MRTRVLGGVVAASVALIAFAWPAGAQAASPQGQESKGGGFTYAVYGDAPYGTSPTDTSETAATPAFIAAVNADPAVSGVVHVGDIHSGSQYCTEAYDRQIRGLWDSFADPLVYTPGDNEWADCHKKKEGGGVYNPATGNIDYVLAGGAPVNYAKGDPAANLDLIRSIFYDRPGQTIGGGNLHTLSQATAYDRKHPEDKRFVENVMWTRGGVVFVTVNVPGGSNNLGDPWYGVPTESAQQTQLRADLVGAATRWISAAFGRADASGAAGVVIVDQADMWDIDGNPAGTAHLSNYEPIIKTIADESKAFGGPVLMLNGDSHVYRSDNPLQQGAACTGDADGGVSVCASTAHNIAIGSSVESWNSHPSYDVPNFHRIVVHGSTTPLEYLRLKIEPGVQHPSTDTSWGIFSWTRVTD